MPTRIQVKRGLSTKVNHLSLSEGEPAFTTDTGKLYIGDGAKKVLINPIEQPYGLNTTDIWTSYSLNEYGQIVSQGRLREVDIPNIPHTKVYGLGNAATRNVGTTSGTIPTLDSNGDVPSSMIPMIASSRVSGLGTVSSRNVGTTSGRIPVLNTKGDLPISTIPVIPVTNISGLGSAALKDIGVSTDQIPVLDSTRKLPASMIPEMPIQLDNLYAYYSGTDLYVTQNKFLDFNISQIKGTSLALYSDGTIVFKQTGTYLINYNVTSKTSAMSTSLSLTNGGALLGTICQTNGNTTPPLCTCSGTLIRSVTANTRMGVKNNGGTTIIVPQGCAGISVVKLW